MGPDRAVAMAPQYEQLAHDVNEVMGFEQPDDDGSIVPDEQRVA